MGMLMRIKQGNVKEKGWFVKDLLRIGSYRILEGTI